MSVTGETELTRELARRMPGAPLSMLTSQIPWGSGRPVLTTLARPESWSEQADCLSFPPDLWHPDKGETVAGALAICSTCPVRSECLESALDERHGIWGGTTPAQRRAIRRSRTAKVA